MRNVVETRETLESMSIIFDVDNDLHEELSA